MQNEVISVYSMLQNQMGFTSFQIDQNYALNLFILTNSQKRSSYNKKFLH